MADEKLKLIIKTEPKALFVSPIDEDIIYYHTTSRVSNVRFLTSQFIYPNFDNWNKL